MRGFKNGSKIVLLVIGFFAIDIELWGITMALAALSSKGQVTIPKQVRKGLWVAAGDRIEFIEIAPGRYEVLAAIRYIAELKGIL